MSFYHHQKPSSSFVKFTKDRSYPSRPPFVASRRTKRVSKKVNLRATTVRVLRSSFPCPSPVWSRTTKGVPP